jgi:hypothetical protein
MRHVKHLLAAVALAAFLFTLSGHGDEPQKDKEKEKVSDLMQKKLKASQNILEGITTNDFRKISDNAEDLIALSKEAEWKVLKTTQYELHSNDFRRTAETLIQDAKDKNLDAAALTYVELTLNCVKCHKYVRERRMTRLDPGPAQEAGGELFP